MMMFFNQVFQDRRRPVLRVIAGRILYLGLLLAVLATAADRKAVAPPNTPTGGTSSPGILSAGTLFVSGQVGEDVKTKKIPTDFEAEVKICFSNISLVLKAGGMDLQDVVAVQVYLTDLSLFPRMNAVYTTFFAEPRPARTTVGVTKLTDPGAHIEITVTARK
jgi:2-iminobutanoate/2-iminopropanoate deaminase